MYTALELFMQAFMLYFHILNAKHFAVLFTIAQYQKSQTTWKWLNKRVRIIKKKV